MTDSLLLVIILLITARTKTREPPTVNKHNQAKIKGIVRGIATPVKNANKTRLTVVMSVPNIMAHKACEFIYLSTARYKPNLKNASNPAGINSANSNQLLMFFKGSKLSSLTTSASQKANIIKIESINNVIKRFFARGALKIERTKLSKTNSFHLYFLGLKTVKIKLLSLRL